jgi:hypothetical protein
VRQKAAQGQDKTKKEQEESTITSNQNEITIALKTTANKLKSAEGAYARRNKREARLSLMEIGDLLGVTAVGLGAVIPCSR